MKKAAGILLAAALIVSGCGANNDSSGSANQQGANAPVVEQASKEKKGKDVQITLPAGMFEGQDIDQVIAEAKQEGVKEAVKNDDGSVTYTMSKANHDEMLKELGNGIADYADELLSDGSFPSVKDVSYSKDYSEFTLTVDKAAYESSMDGFVTMGMGIQGMMYQMMQGISTEDQKVTIHVKDEASGEVFQSVVYPDALQNS
ncbi:hypothetical protein [Paenibacillus daejeonensis]|uniref:hypothetical protein n=1 Tax=Paenibacillus daejeonensis TaxID=135193 RepID=UPI000592F6C6|nr:hypothetical protein [Paenibacillus daejeonensis]